MTKFKTIDLSISKLEANRGQIEGLPKNPRIIRDERFQKLVKSIQDDPEMLSLRELIVYPIEGGKYVVIAGNMRLKAMQELGYKECPVKVLPEDTPVEKLRAYAIKDNVAYGDTDWDIIQSEWNADELSEWGMDIQTWSTTNFEPITIPTIDTSEVSREDIETMKEKLAEAMVKVTSKKDCICPECGAEFTIDG